MGISKADVKAVVDSRDEPTLDECISDLQSQHGLDRSEARVQLLTSTRQQYQGGDTILEWDGDAEFEDFTADAQGKTFEKESETESPESPDSPSVGETQEWERGSITFDANDVDQETPPETDENFYHLPIRDDVGHPLVPERRDYFTQEVADGVNDLEEFTFKIHDNDFGVLLTGEPGTGKGHMVKHVAAEANIPLIRINMGTGITKKKLVGGFVPRANEEGLNDQLERAKRMAEENDLTVGKALDTLSVREKFTWKDGWFTKAFKNGWWILLDEINAAPAEAMMPFFGALEDKKSRSLELTERSQTIRPHPGFRMIATRNPVHHKGTNPMNDALKDRMYEIQKDYLPSSAESRLIKSQTGIETGQADQLVEIADSIRAAYPDQVSRTLTPRGLKRIGNMVELYGFETAVNKELIEGVDFEDEKDAIQRRVEQVLN